MKRIAWWKNTQSSMVEEKMRRKLLVLLAFMMLLLWNTKAYATESSDIIVPVNVMINTVVELDSKNSRIDYLFKEKGSWKETGFVGDQDGQMVMIQADPGTNLYIVAYPKDKNKWSINEEWFNSSDLVEQVETKINFVTVKVPSTGGSFDIVNKTDAYSENDIYLKYAYDGFISSNIVLGDKQLTVEEIKAYTGHMGNESDAAVKDIDQTALQNSQLEPSGEISKRAQQLIDGVDTSVPSTRMEILEDQIRILREEKGQLQQDYDSLRGSDTPEARQNSLNQRVSEVQERNQLLLNDNAALSLAIMSKNRTIEDLRDEIARLSAELEEALKNQKTEEEEPDPVVEYVPEVVVEEEPVEEVIIPEPTNQMLQPEQFDGVFGNKIIRNIAIGTIVLAIIGGFIFLIVTGRLMIGLRKANNKADKLIDRIINR